MQRCSNSISESQNQVFDEGSKGDYVLKINPIISVKRYLEDGVKILIEIENVGDAASPRHAILFRVDLPYGSSQEKSMSIPQIDPKSKHVDELMDIKDRRECTRFTIKDILTENEKDKMKLFKYVKESTNERCMFRICFLNLHNG